MIARFRLEEGKELEQSIADHTRNVMDYAYAEGSKIGIGAIVKFAALLHDRGKDTEEFLQYLNSQKDPNEKQRRGSVDHASAGAGYIYMNYHKGKPGKLIFAELLSYAVAAHHGLFDIIDESRQTNHLLRRIQKMENDEEGYQNFQKEVLSQYAVDDLFDQAYKEFVMIAKRVGEFDKIHSNFYYGCFQRLLLSLLMDADWSDARAFAEKRKPEPAAVFTHIDEARSNYTSYMKELQKKSSEKNQRTDKEKEILQLRQEIKEECIAFGKNPAGIYCLPIPTGGGKTLSGLGYALEFWKEHPETERVLYLSPYISITEQNTDVIRKAIGEKEWVLEHHSNVVNETEQNDEQEAEVFVDWDKPFVCTTMVQFLNTLFSSKKQSIVRFHKLKNAVIIIDEVQSLPLKTIHTFNLMMNFLNQICHANIILCTATQPQLADTEHPILYSEPKNMIRDVTEHFEKFERVNIIPLPEGKEYRYEYSYEELCDLTLEQIREKQSVLVILNTKYAVQMLYEMAREKCDDTIEVVYLTTNLCAEHRTEKIQWIKGILKERNKKLLVISTNLIEAGVDLSAECVIRSVAGLDRIAQAAGRCNRNGESEKGQVLLVSVKDEKKERMEELISSIQATEDVLEKFDRQKGNSILAPEWMDEYYELFYHRNKNKMDFNVKNLGGDNSIYKLLTKGFALDCENPSKWNETLMRQAYKTAGDYYNVIDQNGVEIIVPYKEGIDYISQLEQAEKLREIKQLLKKVQCYTVTVFQYKAKELEEKGVIRLYEKVPGIYIAMSYDEMLGIVSKQLDLIY